jgi:hypothetical protein
MIKMLIMATAAVVAMATPALACSPAPTCWLKAGPSYYRSICQSYAKDKRTVAEITAFMSVDIDEPEKVPDFVKACKKLGISFRKG